MEGSLTAEERARNGQRLERLYVSTSHSLAPDIFELVDDAAAAGGDAPTERAIDPRLTGALPLRSMISIPWPLLCRAHQRSWHL